MQRAATIAPARSVAQAGMRGRLQRTRYNSRCRAAAAHDDAHRGRGGYRAPPAASPLETTRSPRHHPGRSPPRQQGGPSQRPAIIIPRPRPGALTLRRPASNTAGAMRGHGTGGGHACLSRRRRQARPGLTDTGGLLLLAGAELNWRRAAEENFTTTPTQSRCGRAPPKERTARSARCLLPAARGCRRASSRPHKPLLHAAAQRPSSTGPQSSPVPRAWGSVGREQAMGAQHQRVA